MRYFKIIYYVVIIMYLDSQLKKEKKYNERMQWCNAKIIKYREKLEKLL